MRSPFLIMAFASAPLMLASAAHAERHYDCSKPGNADKAACKTGATAAAPASPVAMPTAPVTTASTSTRHYDCSKAGNANKAACKTVAAPATAATAPVPQAKPSVFSRMMKPKVQPAAPPASTATPAAKATTVASAPGGSYAGKSITTNSAGATGQCRDGTFTHATHHSGACSSHGGVAKWM